MATRAQWPALLRATLGRLGEPAAALAELAGARGQQLFMVGGAVRDALLAIGTGGAPRGVRDVDAVVLGAAIPLAEQLPRLFGGVLETSPRFGTATWHHPDFGTLDVATARRETYAHPAALPTVSPTHDLAVDLRRRDFSVNAIAAALDAQCTLHDPLGGEAALARRELAVLHERSFVDDPTRLWRGARLAARLDLTWETNTAELASAAARGDAQAGLSPARLGSELALALAEPSPPAVFAQLAEHALTTPLGLTPAAAEQLRAALPAIADLTDPPPGWLEPRPSNAQIWALLLAFVLPPDSALLMALVETGLVGTALRPHRQALIAAARNHAHNEDAVEFAVAMAKLVPQERAAVWALLRASAHAQVLVRWAERDWACKSVVTAEMLKAHGVTPSPAMAQALGAALRCALAGGDADAQLRAALRAQEHG